MTLCEIYMIHDLASDDPILIENIILLTRSLINLHLTVYIPIEGKFFWANLQLCFSEYNI